MSTVEVVQYRGSTQQQKIYPSHGTEHPLPTVFMISPTCIMISSHGTEHPHGTQDICPGYHDIPHGTEHTLYRVIINENTIKFIKHYLQKPIQHSIIAKRNKKNVFLLNTRPNRMPAPQNLLNIFRTMLLLINCEVHTGKYSDRSLDVRTERSEIRKKIEV